MAELDKMGDATKTDGRELSDAELEGIAGGLTEENKHFLMGMVKECKSRGMNAAEAHRYMLKRFSPTTDKFLVDQSMAFFLSAYRAQ